ncbi:MAG: helix-turn-helix domain-containing protein [Desulfobacteraceae bacterium]|nr:helix-turn-helix domain-containing protein [Desulfobacteraceae bacterium]
MELLTVEEFAERMKISRTTVFDWIRKGTLKIGRHYLKIGRVIRFEWGPDLLRKLKEDSVEKREEPQENRSTKRLNLKRPNNRRAAINLEY